MPCPSASAFAQRAVLYAALSTGQVGGRTNPRMSLLFVSRPGVGKKLLCQQALLLNPVGYPVQSGMATPAGLCASVTQAGGAFRASPGLLALGDEGAVCLEDLHHLDTGQLAALRDCLASVTEDGELYASKAARAGFRARTALHMSLNRRSDLRGRRLPPGPGARLTDLSLTLDLLSRIDVLCDLDVGDDAARAAREMLAGPGTSTSASTSTST